MKRTFADFVIRLSIDFRCSGGAAASASPAGKIRAMFTPPDDPDRVPHNILFVEDLTDRVSAEFPELWKLGQAYFKGELHVEPDTGKQVSWDWLRSQY